MKIKQLLVSTPQGPSGLLDKESRFVFNYGQGRDPGERSREVSLTMPIRAESYASGALPAPFAMNKPEGWLFQQIAQRMAKYELLDDMRLLSIVGGNQIGRLRYQQPEQPRTPRAAHVGLQELLSTAATRELFDFLVETYFESGISGVQPKVLIPDADQPLAGKATVVRSALHAPSRYGIANPGPAL